MRLMALSAGRNVDATQIETAVFSEAEVSSNRTG
jgi:hypothetical protein